MGHQSYVLLCTETTLSNPPVVQPKCSCDVHLLRSPWLRAGNKRMKFCSNWFMQFKNPVRSTFSKNQVHMDRANVWSLNSKLSSDKIFSKGTFVQCIFYVLSFQCKNWQKQPGQRRARSGLYRRPWHDSYVSF